MHIMFDPKSEKLADIKFDDFLTVDIRVGTVLKCVEFPETRNPSYKLEIDFGKGVGIMKSCAQITNLYSCEELVGRQICAVVNFPPRQIGKSISEVLVLGLSNEKGEISLIRADHDIPNGTRLT